MEKEFKTELGVAESIPTVDIPTEAFLPPAQPVEAVTSIIPWGGIGYGILVVAGIAIATKILSD
tara:strand:- start:307 stop:498 length:192 start_codon:yes stop_codon:yes gene_type:complete